MGKMTYNDIFSGEEDDRILEIIGNYSSDSQQQKIRKMLTKIIENELTPRQREVITEYYFNNKKMSQIAEESGISVSAVSAKISAGKCKIYKFMKYCIRCNICKEVSEND